MTKPTARAEPQRTCVGCRETGDKASLSRFHRGPGGDVVADPTGRGPGRGAYLHQSAECVELARKRRALERALKPR